MPKGGARPGAGRPWGSKGRKTLEGIERLEKIKASGLSPLEYLLSLMRNDKETQAVRLDAAKAAAPYVHPKLANLDATVKGDANAPLAITQVDGCL